MAMKAKARLDLLARVISVAASLVFILSNNESNSPARSPAFALAERTTQEASSQPVTKARKKTKSISNNHGCGPIDMALRTMASTTRIKKKVKPTD